MTSTDTLQDRLLSRQPNLHWLLNEQGNVIEPLFQQWGRQIQARKHDTESLSIIRDVLLWAVEKKVSPAALQAPFNWLHTSLVTTYAHHNDSDMFLHTLKTQHPELLQQLMENTPWTNSVWDTAFALKYTPEPKKLWDTQPKWEHFYKGSNPLAWSKKENTHYHFSLFAIPDEATTKTMHEAMDVKAFALWQYGAFMAILSQNTSLQDGLPVGKKYGLAAGLKVLEPAIKLGLAPDAQTLAQDTVRRYKGQGLVEDMLKGLNHCMEHYDTIGFTAGTHYCSKMLNTIVPFAIQDQLYNSRNAVGMDRKITEALRTGRMDESIALAWFEKRIREGRAAGPVNIKTFAPLWPASLCTEVLALESRQQRKPKANDAQTALDLLKNCSFEPTATKTTLQSMTPMQWSELQKLLDDNERTSDVVSLLKTTHPWIEAYKSSPRARIAVVAACMVYINESTYGAIPKYKDLWELLSTNNETSIESLSMPQPLGYFANCFPQYRETWQRLACEMAMQPENDPQKAAKHVVNALASLMLGKSVDAQSLLDMRASLDPDMEYETLVQTQFNTVDAFELPATFDETAFSAEPFSP